MKTPEALKIVADLAACHRQLQQSAALTSKNYPGRNAKGLRAHYRKHAKDHGARAEALELILSNHSNLRARLDHDAAMLDYVANAPRSGIEITRHDLAEIKAHKKVTNHVLKITKP